MSISENWLKFFRDAIRFCESIQGLPDECPCEDASSHLAGRCPCCGVQPRRRLETHAGGDCTDLLASLRAEASLLCDAFKHAAGPMEEALGKEDAAGARREFLMAAADLHHVLADLERTNEAVVGFLRSCAVSDMKRIKRHSASLRAHCEGLNSHIRR